MTAFPLKIVTKKPSKSPKTQTKPHLVHSVNLLVRRLSHSGCSRGVQEFFEVEKDLIKNIPFFPALGNHEYWTSFSPGAGTYTEPESYKKYFVLLTNLSSTEDYYSFDYGNSHFLVVNTNDKGVTYVVTAGGGASLSYVDPSGTTEDCPSWDPDCDLPTPTLTSIIAESTYHAMFITVNGEKVNVEVKRTDGSILDKFTVDKERR